ncbi:MAG: aminopeptidase P family protein [SAR202 cluster bacterium]|nr:aminopeptidase P family protein [SAR202 cluster bacterium]
MTNSANILERDRRFKAVREAMVDEGLVGLIIAGHGSNFGRGYIRYFADVHIWEDISLIFIPLDGDPVHVHVTYSLPSMPDTLWIPDFRQWPEPEKELVKAIRDKGVTNGNLGIAGFKKRFAMGVYEALKEGMHGIKFVNADRLVDRIRALKSDFEIQKLRSLWQMSQGAMERFVEVVGPGVTQREAAAEAAKVIRAAGSFTDLTLIQEGAFKGLPKDVPLRCDDWINFHLEVCGESGHWSEINVVCAFKGPDKFEQKLMEAEYSALKETRSAAKPGISLKELNETFLKVITDNGWELGEPAWHYSFHGQGMDAIEWPYFTPMPEGSEDTILEEGMVFSYHPHRDTIPAVRRPPKIFDGLVITKTGAETLTTDWDFLWRIKK